jgi:hypothetical protein
MKYVAAVVVSVFLSAAAPREAAAQDVGSGARIATDGVEFVTGVMDFDLSGTGKTAPMVFRTSKSLTNRLGLEIGATLAWPSQQFGSSTIVLPEALLSWSWRLGPVRPFVSGGVGLMAESALSEIDWEPTFLGGGGARIQLSKQLYAIGEMRLRGISSDFSASTAEWLGGIGFTFR